MELNERQNKILRGEICPYCWQPTELVDSSEVYGPGNSYGMLYLCRKCGAWVGTHKVSRVALGRLADVKLRNAKKEAHFYFDRIWRFGFMQRVEAYKWLSEQLNLPEEYTHIGMFNVETCKKVIKLSCEYLKEHNKDGKLW